MHKMHHICTINCRLLQYPTIRGGWKRCFWYAMYFFMHSKHVCLLLCRWRMVPVPADSDPLQSVRSAVGYVPLPLPGSCGPWHWFWLCCLQACGPKWRWLNGNGSLPFGWWWVWCTDGLIIGKLSIQSCCQLQRCPNLDRKGIRLKSHIQTCLTQSIILTLYIVYAWNSNGWADTLSLGKQEKFTYFTKCLKF